MSNSRLSTGPLLARRTLWIAVGIVVVAGVLRLANIGWSYSNDGIDEGIMAERAMLIREGSRPYHDLPCDQAPLAFYLGAALGGDIVDLRVFVAAMSLLAVAVCMLVSRRVCGDRAMVVTGLLLAFDFAFVRESRLFSLDALCSVFMALGFAAFVVFIERRGWGALALSGVLVGLSAATKLFGVLGLLAMLVFILIESREKGTSRTKAPAELALLAIAAALPLGAFALLLGPSEMWQGMVADQGGRGLDLYLKLSLVAYFGVNLAYVLPLVRVRTLWKAEPRTRFLVCAVAVLLAFMVLQPLVFFHHLVLMSPVLAVLTGVTVESTLKNHKSAVDSDVSGLVKKKKAFARTGLLILLTASLLTSYSLSVYGISAQQEPLQVEYARWLREVTTPDDYVISGDPTIPALAGRLVPPETVNVAYRQSPDITADDVEQAVVDYGPAVVIICYRLGEMDGLAEFLEARGYVQVQLGFPAPDRAVLDLFQEGIGDVIVYVRGP